MLSWTLRRARLPLPVFRCVRCHSGVARRGDGTFHVNPNGQLLDRWLLVACASCDRTSTITVHDRVPVRYLDPMRHGRHFAERQNSPRFFVPTSRRHGPEPGREARWPCPGLHHAAIRARSVMTGHERRSGPVRSGRRW
ncbi:DUF1062 domain-containing protein [Micromonospora sp. AMSO31t]|nr:DUF1062 domain-containing protein [Micromonospora sp. AMSO31t]